jgi:Domain of unknown function (DUF4350)
MTRNLAQRIAIAALVIAVCAGGFFACFERREVDVWKGASAEARRNRYLALGRLLGRMGHPVVAQSDLSQLGQLPDPPATVILPLNRTAFGEKRSEALLDWVARGGHLVVETYTVWGPRENEEGEPEPGAEDVILDGRPDLLLDRFGLRQRQRKRDLVEAAAELSTEAESGEVPERAPPPPTVPELLKGEWNIGRPERSFAYFEEDGEPLELEFNADFWWEDTQGVALWSVAGDSGAHLVEIAHGDGRISALTSDEPLLNDSIGRADHAEFVVRWLRDGREARVPVWIFFEEEWPSLLALLRRHAAPALLGAAALFSMWLWRALWRFGPALPAPDPARRRWLEHLEAAGRFHWRQDRGRTLMSGLRADVLRELERKRPAWHRLPERERMERLAHASGLSLQQVAHALLDATRAPRSLIAAVRSLERIRASL